jgi:acetyl-CoA C-acetyltransferase
MTDKPHSPRTPVLIGAGQKTYRKGTAPGSRRMLSEVVALAAADAGLAAGALAQTDTVGVVGFTVDSPGRLRQMPLPRLTNPPAALAEDIGAKPRVAVYTHMGGNSPQGLLNWASEKIARGEADLIVLAGAEFLGDLMKRVETGGDLSIYGGGPEGEPERWGDDREGCTPQEAAHGVSFPANIYPMFENALRAKLGRSLEAHQRAMGALFARFNAVASENPDAWFPTRRSAAEIATEGPDNRMVGFPYTKYLNAIIRVDQAAAVIVASSACADRLAVAADKRVYLHGCGDANEVWNPIERDDLAAAPAIGLAARKAFAMAGIGAGDVALFDIYSCFPSAVEIACREIGVAEDDPRPLTVTGGLPYFGGPGNNYVMHSIAAMMARLRAQPGAFGMVTANGWYLTKHAVGLYSTTPPAAPFEREDPKVYQREIDARARPEIAWEPSGRATIEAYTVVHGRDDVRMGIVYGRDAQNRRLIANTPEDKALLRDLQSREGVGRTGTVVAGDGGMKNVFTPD